ncbi:MAG: ABC transporter ATP-binding protein [Propionibacteriaceae bacterium]|jgi:ABC-2 type transport system ATP-binding protein|nr:ABC transporter ATP-binding protein [Propionibacteriaceae bacterium]
MSDQIDAIRVQTLRKAFGAVKALDGLDLQVERGEVAGFLGPNGAGKSTTIRILLGLIRADQPSGSVEVLGLDPWAQATELHQRLAYVPGDVSLWPTLTGGETIDFLGSLHGGLDQAKRAQLIDRFELDPTRKNRTYSKGNRQKVALIAALASPAELYLLDEPTSGLDPLMEAVFTECLTEIKAAGGTVLLSSHILAEVEETCDTVTIIRAGRTVESGSLADLRHLARSQVEARLRGPAPGLAALPGVHALVEEAGQVRFACDHGVLERVMAELVQAGVESLTCGPPSLEQLFLSHYADGVAADGLAQAVSARSGARGSA